MSNEFCCVVCDSAINRHRYEIGYTTCKSCGEKEARKVRHCIVPMAKSNYIVVTDRELLKQLNKYART
jgi:ribosomal protein L37AE/L43A